MLIGLFMAVLSIVLDQLSKFYVDTRLVVDSPVEVNDYFNVVKVWNTGVSFSMFNNYGDIGANILVAVALVVCCGLLYWMFRETNTKKNICLGLIIGGALGNVLDRVRYGAVMDFLDFHYETHHWPAFNVADSCICIGALILIYMEMTSSKKKGLYEI